MNSFQENPELGKLHFSRKPGLSKMSSSSEDLVNSLFSLYEKWGSQNYIGEKVSQLQHAQQVHLCSYIWCQWEKISWKNQFFARCIVTRSNPFDLKRIWSKIISPTWTKKFHLGKKCFWSDATYSKIKFPISGKKFRGNSSLKLYKKVHEK